MPGIASVAKANRKQRNAESINNKFVGLLKANRCLWDLNHPGNQCTELKSVVWEDVAFRMKWSASQTKEEYAKLRAVYQCNQKLRNLRNSGNLNLLDKLSFLSKSFPKNVVKKPIAIKADRGSPAIEDSQNSSYSGNHENSTGSSFDRVNPMEFVFLDPNDMVSIPGQTEGLQEQAIPRNDDLSIRSVHSLYPNASNGFSNQSTHVEEQSLPQVASVVVPWTLPSSQPSGFTLALDEKLRLFPPRARIKLEKDIFEIVSNEAAQLFHH
ncbi:uncharacterized protein LOC132265446 isoform X1 [Phlebotomus argentipes]|uniref:uncharacterized protein LOC132265446 isoform X1 n=1 Tax=Phlebotomus argentipes TaxID=94469 RepID=UPI002892F09D|nr:uncharacterized protein LOC132265446 isoform X1 [Phlebotomus argentipes]